MTPTRIKLAVYGGLLLLAWLCSRRGGAGPGRVTRVKEINADVSDPMFGVGVGDFAIDPEMDRLIKQSNALIAADDAANPES